MALPLALAFLGASVVPVYFVWLMPELFNFSLVLYAVFFWAYKEVASDKHPFLTGTGVRLRRSRASWAGHVLETPAPARARPMVLLAASRRQWKHAATTVLSSAEP